MDTKVSFKEKIDLYQKLHKEVEKYCEKFLRDLYNETHFEGYDITNFEDFEILSDSNEILINYFSIKYESAVVTIEEFCKFVDRVKPLEDFEERLKNG